VTLCLLSKHVVLDLVRSVIVQFNTNTRCDLVQDDLTRLTLNPVLFHGSLWIIGVNLQLVAAQLVHAARPT